MARSFSNAKLLSAFVVDGISNAVSRRGYATASPGVVSSVARGTGARSAAMLKKSGEEMVGSTEKVSWVPDPVTGVYRPENLANELDVADLRAVLLRQKN
ncbi:Late embryogenesis abundant protein Lea5 [Melia azedarach]|uniref:Late embryogenesis abundant protein Lea5 n=1 Tax=Melia azedarach TaxID=155640 RepID=A0ACC1YVA9_MELAZ|nr:Late embryogenesis abundant protein Lea5 [Melia azedarach]